LFWFCVLLFFVYFAAVISIVSRQLFSAKKLQKLPNPLHATFLALNSTQTLVSDLLMKIVEHLAAENTDILLWVWQRLNINLHLLENISISI